MTSKISDLEDELLEVIRDSLGPQPTKTLEEAFEEALENTTPSSGGAPRRKETVQRDQSSEWI